MSSSIKDQLITAYLNPLLEKHERRKVITWEDLMEAKQSAEAVLLETQQQQQSIHATAETSHASEEFLKLHKSQVMLYREQAMQSVQEWCRTWALPNPTGMDESADQYTQRCISQAFEDRPFWKMGTGLLQKVLSPVIKERAALKYAEFRQNQKPSTTATKPEVNKQDIETGEEGDDEDGEVEEHGTKEETGETEVGEETDDDDNIMDAQPAEELTSSNNQQQQAPQQKYSATKKRLATKKNIQHKKKAASTEKGNAAVKKAGGKRIVSRRGRGGGTAGGNTSTVL
jgi:hypothetical protein